MTATRSREVFTETGTRRANGVVSFPRDAFARERFDYRPGEHVVYSGPTQRGKTSLAFLLLEHAASPECPAYVAVSKPRDPVTEREGARLGYRRVETWPVPRKVSEIMGEKPSGYLVWPRFGNLDTDDIHAAHVTRTLLRDRYAAGMKHEKSILVMDDTVQKSELGLDRDMKKILTMAGAMDVGMWAFVQKPTDAGKAAIWSYSQSEHVFMAHDPDENNAKRYGEIGGVDPRRVRAILESLQQYEFLYIKRTGSHMCIVEAS